MNIDDIIEHSDYAKLPGVSVWGHYKGGVYFDEPATDVVWLTVDDAPRFFELRGKDRRHYKLISSSSDFSVALQYDYPYWERLIKLAINTYKLNPGYVDLQLRAELVVKPGCNLLHKFAAINWAGIWYTFMDIPDNVDHWWMTHPLVEDPRISSIPFGIPDGARDDLYEVMQENHDFRRNTLYANFNVGSNPEERISLLEYLEKGNPSYYKATLSAPNLSAKDFYRAIAAHETILCPAGNGIDSYRIWESFYLGRNVIVPKALDIFYHEMIDFPFDFYEVDDGKVNMSTSKITNGKIGAPLQMSYWRERFGV